MVRPYKLASFANLLDFFYLECKGFRICEIHCNTSIAKDCM